MNIFDTILTAICLRFVVTQGGESDGGLTTSVAGMEQLLETERLLIQNLDNYATELQKKLLTIRSAVDRFRRENEKALRNPEYYLSIPTNVFALIRRLQKDWVYWDIHMKQSVGAEQSNVLKDHWHELPSRTDFEEAVSAMQRLQETYELKAADLAVGLINGKQYNAKLAAIDCYSMGYELFSKGDYLNAGYWAYTALQIFEEDVTHELLEFSRLQVLELYAETLLKQNLAVDALAVLEVALAMQPNNTELIRKKIGLEVYIKIKNPQPIQRPSVVPSLYQRGCRGEFSNKVSEFHCTYNTTTTPFLKLAPLKMEVIQLDPFMVLFHDVLSDKEIAALQTLARPHLRRATVYNDTQKKNMVVSGRSSKVAWFYDNTNNVTLTINRRIADMTGFDLNGSEMLQVMNYGLGGFYDTHHDFFNVSMTGDIVRMQGDRKATVLFYMTDVEQGGATVFPVLKAAVFPKKGSAVMWYNLNNRFEGDARTLHAGCPVLIGSKWVTNKWIRERNQMFRIPCYKE